MANGPEPNITGEKKEILSFSSNETVKVLYDDGSNFLYYKIPILGPGTIFLDVNGKNKLKLTMELTAFFQSGADFFFGGMKDNETVLARISRKDHVLTVVALPDITISDGVTDDKNIIIAGGKGHDAYLAKLDVGLAILTEQTFGGKGNERFNRIIAGTDAYYVAGVKDAYSAGFSNAGNSGEQKAFLTMVKKDLTLIRHEFLNYHTSDEAVKNMVFIGNHLNLLIKTGNDFLICNLGMNLEFRYNSSLSALFGIFTSDVMMTPGAEGYLIFTIEERGRLHFGIIAEETGEREFVSPLNLDGFLSRINLEKGLLHLWITYGNKLFLVTVDHYLNDAIPFSCAKDYCPIEEMDEAGITSYFGGVKSTRTSISPYFSNSVSGEYLGRYQVMLPSGKTFEAERTITVKPYANVMDGGIYPVNYVLDFFDNARLNGLSVTRNKKLTTPGDYTLILKNNIGLERTLSFKVIGDYYKNDADNIQPADYMVNKGQTITVRLPYQTAYSIQSLILNQEKITDFTYENGYLSFSLVAPSAPGLFYYHLEGIVQTFHDVTLTHDPLLIFSVLVLKEDPILEIEQRQGGPQFLVRISDPSRTAVDIMVNVYDSEVLKASLSTGLKEKKMSLDNLSAGHEYRIEYLFSYHLGDGVMRYKSLLDCQAIVNDTGLTIGELKILKQNQSLEELYLSIQPDETGMDIIRLEAGGQPVALGTTGDQAALGLAIGLGMIIFSLIVGRLIIRKKSRSGK